MNTKLIVTLLVLLVLGGGSYLYLTKNKNNAPLPNLGYPNLPAVTRLASEIKLDLASPKDKETVSAGKVAVSGMTAPGAEVWVNEIETKANSNGAFSVTLALDEGENTINVVANDGSGNYAEAEITVTYEPSQGQ